MAIESKQKRDNWCAVLTAPCREPAVFGQQSPCSGVTTKLCLDVRLDRISLAGTMAGKQAVGIACLGCFHGGGSTPELLEHRGVPVLVADAVALKDNLFIRAGYSANADIVLERRDSVLTVQESLVKYEADTAWVEVEKAPQVFVKRTIKTGLSDGVNVEILSGLTKKDKIKIQNAPADQKKEEKK